MSYRCDSSDSLARPTPHPRSGGAASALRRPRFNTAAARASPRRASRPSPLTEGGGASRSTREYPSRERSYQAEHTRSYPNTEVKQPRAWLVLGWETTMEFHVLFALSLFQHGWQPRAQVPRRGSDPRDLERSHTRPSASASRRDRGPFFLRLICLCVLCLCNLRHNNATTHEALGLWPMQ